MPARQYRLMDLIVHNDIVPAVNQVETHPFYQQIENAAFMKEQSVQHQSWAPFAEGLAGQHVRQRSARFDRRKTQQVRRSGRVALACSAS